DAIRTGGTPSHSEPILLSWEDLGFSVPLASHGPCGTGGCGSQRRPQEDRRLAILEGVSGAAWAWSGSVTAIMGPSGAGKTTL
ncbi:unnamed protein product, partial [Hapterophycus canaliculatus]